MVVDQCLVDFGTHVVGQKVSRVITLTNRGALGTRYMLTPITYGPLQQSFTSTLVVPCLNATVLINELREGDSPYVVYVNF